MREIPLNSIELAGLLAACAGVAFLLGWLAAKSRFSGLFSGIISEHRAEIAALSEAVRHKSAELAETRAALSQTRQELKSQAQDLLGISAERSAAMGRLEQLGQLEATLQKRQDEIRSLNTALTQHKAQQAELETTLHQERLAAQERDALLTDVRRNMTETFKAISSEALRENNQSFLDLAGTSLSKYLDAARNDYEIRGQSVQAMIAPLKSALDRYDQHIQGMERSREKAYGGLSQQVHALVNTQEMLHKETANLAKALRLPHVRGRWGEITLKRVAELSGMQNRCDFFEQPSAQTENGLLRPDMIVKLPGERRIIVDAKVPLSGYLEALEAESDHQRRAGMRTHAKQVQAHIQQLAQKAYWMQFNPTPDFVVLFIPGENFFSAALAHNPKLIEEGAEKGVVLATPTTLISLLKTIAYGWRQETVTANAQAISELGRELFERIYTMANHMNRLGRDIERCAGTYNQVIGSLERRVLASARKFREFGITLEGDRDLVDLEPARTMTRKVDGAPPATATNPPENNPC